MTITSVIATAATLFNLLSVPAFDPPSAGNQPLLVRGGTSGRITADFSQVEYFPNLKSKIGFATNAKAEALIEAGQFIKDIGPGLMCSNIEFDLNFKFSESDQPALNQKFSDPGDPAARATSLSPTPMPWLGKYETMVGDLNVAQLFQLTGAPAQFQVSDAARPAIHPPPTDAAATAKLIGQWTDAANHVYPVMWSMWNEPGHTFMGIQRGRDVAGNPLGGKEKNTAFVRRDSELRTKSAKAFADLYALYDQAMRPTFTPFSGLGLASFLDADFNPNKLSTNGNTYFKDVFDALAKGHSGTKVDYVTFNSVNGNWPVILNGVRAVLGSRTDTGMIIFTQYAPRSMLRNDDGTKTDAQQTEATPMAAALNTLTDLTQIERATDVQHLCMSYWIGNRYGFLSGTGSLSPNVRYFVMKMFTQLPVLRTRLDLDITGLPALGVHGLAGINSAKAAVMLWNDGSTNLTVPLVVSGLPSAFNAQGQVTTLTGEGGPVQSTFDPANLLVPAQSVVLVEFTSGAADPLDRRMALSNGSTRFLQSQSFAERIPASCPKGGSVPNTGGCQRNSGTFGFYDSVRSVAYLGQGDGPSAPQVTASFSALPSVISLSGGVVGSGSVSVEADFPACQQKLTTDLKSGQLDLSAIADSCRHGNATLKIKMVGGSPGSQAEVYLSATASAAQAATTPVMVPADDLSISEGLIVEKLRH